MDVVKKRSKKSFPVSPRVMMIATAVITVLVLISWARQVSGSVSVPRHDLIIANVERGDLEVIIDGYGSLTSDKQQLITSFSSATVKEIVLKPGAEVTPDSVIVRMENPELVQNVEDAQQELNQLQANLRQLRLTNQREKLNEKATLSEIESNLESAKLKRVAEEKLVAKGIVSDLNFQETVLTEKQLEKRLAIQIERNQQLELVHKEALNIQQERIKQQQGRLNIAQSRLDKLTVRAGFHGVLQRLSVDLGQSVPAGGEVALIGSLSDLIALVRVPQSQAQQVQIGQTAIVNTRRDEIKGVVSRIDPIVADNTVEVEIALPETLPASARNQLSINASIIAETLKDVAYIKRPAGVKSNQSIKLYQMNEDGSTASLTTVRFGAQAGQYMEVTDGAAVNQAFVISDLSNLHESNTQISID